MSSDTEGTSTIVFDQPALSPVPDDWALFADAVGLRHVDIRPAEDNGWWITLSPAFNAKLAGPPYESESFGFFSQALQPAPEFLFGSKLGSLLVHSTHREDALWAASSIPKGVLWQAQKEGDTLATPAHLSDLIHALLDHAPKLVELFTDAQDVWLERAFKVLGLAVPDVASQRRTFFDIYPPTLSYREVRRRGVPTLRPRLSADFLEKHAPTDSVRAELAANDDELPFVLNGLLADLLEAIGKTGAELAKKLRLRQAEYRADANPYTKWKPWVRLLTDKGLPGPLALTWICQALWQDVVRPKVERARKNPAAVARVVTSQALGLLAHPPPLPRSEGQQSILFPQDSGWSLAPSIDTELLDAVLKGTGDLSSEVAIDLFEWLITAAHKQYVDATGDFRTLVIEGGWSELARLLGATRSGSAEKVRALALAFAHLRYDLRGWGGNLLSYAETKAAPGRKACVKLTLGEMLVHGFTFTLKEASGSVGLQAREDRQLVPILGKAAVVGSPASFGAQRRMTWGLATLLRSRAVELAREGGVILSPHDWADLANNAGAPRSATLLGKVQAAWEEGDDKKAIPPLIERNESRVTLHESRRPALDFIKQAGETSQRQSNRGRRGVQARSRAPRGKKPA